MAAADAATSAASRRLGTTRLASELAKAGNAAASSSMARTQRKGLNRQDTDAGDELGSFIELSSWSLFGN